MRVEQNESNPMGVFENVIKATIRRFARNPFVWFYEEDARSEMVADLRSHFENRRFFWRRLEELGFDQGSVESSPVKAEYPHYGDPQRYDIGYLKGQTLDNLYEVPVSIAMEIKLGSDRIGADKWYAVFVPASVQTGTSANSFVRYGFLHRETAGNLDNRR
jgi:hypothetical protein